MRGHSLNIVESYGRFNSRLHHLQDAILAMAFLFCRHGIRPLLTSLLNTCSVESDPAMAPTQEIPGVTFM